MRKGTLQRRILGVFAIVLLGLGLFVSFSIWLLARQAVRDQVRNDVDVATSTLRMFLDRQRDTLKLQAQLVADQPALRAIAADKELINDKATVADRLEVFRKAVKADGLAFFDMEGNPKVSLGHAPKKFEPLTSSQEEDAYQGRFKDGFDAVDKGFLLSSSAPVKVGALSIGYVTVYSLVGDTSARLLADAVGGQVAFALGGQVVASSLAEFKTSSDSSAFPETKIGDRTYGIQGFEMRDPNTDRRINVTVLHDVESSTAPYRTLMTVFLALMPFALIAVLILGSFLAKGIARPISDVAKAAQKLQIGEWPDPLMVTRRDEIGVLQSVFNETVLSLRTAQNRLLSMIDLDPLTELENHRRFKETLGAEVQRSKVANESLSLLLFDVDKFKEFNDANGLIAGDGVLVGVAQLLRRSIPEYAVAARYSGDRFAVLLPSCDLEAAEFIGIKICAEMKRELPGTTLSGGCATFGINTSAAEGLIMAAELALARAKHLGRNMICRFDSVPGADENADPYQLFKYTQDASLATIQALAAAVDAKDAYTKGHSIRVAQYATDLCRVLGGSEADLDLVYRTGTLHDVGKIGVPDSILKKPARLEEDERAIMETHPVLGEVIVRKAPQLEDTIPGVRHHHEAWNGKGYPDGLAGEDIPYVARLLAVADTFDAMTSDRPYRKGLPLEVALSEIAKGAGTQFDPEMAKAFVELMQTVEWPMAA